MENLFGNVLNLTADGTLVLTARQLIICTLVSLVLGLIIALLYMYKNRYTKDFVITLVILPAVVQLVIMLVNGNLGAGLAVAGAFALVRFRSLPGTSKEIATLFMAMAVGLAMGMGYIGYAILFLVLVELVMFVLNLINFGEGKTAERELKVVIPENLDYETVFDDLFEQYTTEHRMAQVKSTNMGSMFELKYAVKMKNGVSEKEFLDAIRVRNGNLTVSCGRLDTESKM